jgi:hypothetical protein
MFLFASHWIISELTFFSLRISYKKAVYTYIPTTFLKIYMIKHLFTLCTDFVPHNCKLKQANTQCARITRVIMNVLATYGISGTTP